MKGTIFSVCSRNTSTDVLQSCRKNAEERTRFGGRWSRRVHRGVFPGGLTVYSTVREQTSLNEGIIRRVRASRLVIALGVCRRCSEMHQNTQITLAK